MEMVIRNELMDYNTSATDAIPNISGAKVEKWIGHETQKQERRTTKRNARSQRCQTELRRGGEGAARFSLASSLERARLC